MKKGLSTIIILVFDIKILSQSIAHQKKSHAQPKSVKKSIHAPEYCPTPAPPPQKIMVHLQLLIYFFFNQSHEIQITC